MVANFQQNSLASSVKVRELFASVGHFGGGVVMQETSHSDGDGEATELVSDSEGSGLSDWESVAGLGGMEIMGIIRGWGTSGISQGEKN